MKFLELAEKRFSVRKFKNQPIEKEVLNSILEANRFAPSAMNLQSQKIFVAQSEEALNVVKRFTISHYDAPCILIVGYDKELITPDTEDYLLITDPAIALTHIMLQATEMGVGSVWVRSCDFDGLLYELKLPSTFVPMALMPLGYPSDDYVPSEKHFARKALDEIVTYL